MNNYRLTGGFNGYKEAVNEGFSVNIHNPTLRYSDRKGFHIESNLTPKDDDAIDLGDCSYYADNGNQSFGATYRDYLETKAEIIRIMSGDNAADMFEKEHGIGYYECF